MKDFKTGDLIKKYRIEKSMTQSDLAAKIGFEDRSTISKIERNQRNVNQEQIAKIAAALDVPPSKLIIADIPIETRPLPKVYNCKYYHSVSAGIGTFADEDCDTYSYFFSSQAQADHCFAVDIEGDSMLPELRSGDVAIVDTEKELSNGDVVVFVDKSEDLGYIKQYHKTDNEIMFISYNSAYKPMIFPLSALNDRIKICGKVIKSLRDF